MSDEPWKDWIPGVLSDKQVKELCDHDYITCLGGSPAIGPSSIDLHLSDEGYIMPQGSVKPFGGRYISKINRMGLAEKLESGRDCTFVLSPKKTYLFKLSEKLEELKDTKIYGQATAKSSVGRIDVLARLIVDGMDCYEVFEPKKIGNGEMYIEITPITFGVRVKQGIALSQLRLFYGNPDNAVMQGEELYAALLHRDDDKKVDGALRVDLTKTRIYGDKVTAFCASDKGSSNDRKPVDLWEPEDESMKPNPESYWDISLSDDKNRFIIRKGSFYILRSKERIALPKGIAVYCRATDETIGEMRIHYAGFVHPYFGRNRVDGKTGTPLIFEVRGHDVDVNLGDDEKMANLIFYRMSEDCTEADKTPYNDQTLKLSKFFQEWKGSGKSARKGK